MWSYAFNATVPTAGGGTAPNNVIIQPGPGMGTLIGKTVADAPLSGILHGCNSTCSTKLRAPALASTACTSQMIPANYTTLFGPKMLASSSGKAPPLEQEAFFVSILLVIDEDGSESINLVTAYAEVKDCVGVLNMTACTLKSAVAEYDVTVNDGNVALENAADPRVLSLANNTYVGYKESRTPGVHPSECSDYHAR